MIAGTENTATRCALHTALLVTHRPVMEVHCCTDSGLQLRIREDRIWQEVEEEETFGGDKGLEREKSLHEGENHRRA